jgi:hypothetical protein
VTGTFAPAASRTRMKESIVNASGFVIFRSRSEAGSAISGQTSKPTIR